MKSLILFISFFSIISLMSQINPLMKDGSIYNLQRKIYFKSNDHFTTFRNSFYHEESLYDDSTFLNKNLIDIRNKKKPSQGNIIINPVFDFTTGLQNGVQAFTNTFGLGLNIFGTGINKKIVFGITAIGFSNRFMDYQNQIVTKNKVVPGMNVKRGIDRINSTYLSSFLNFKANKFFDFEFGYGRQFIGDGYRSLLLSDFANASPYFKLNTKFWKIKYTNLFASHQNIFNVEGKPSFYQKKYTATHFLDLNITKWMSFGLFETIIWQANEGKYKRGIDPNYLNPIIFYRPVEFSVGSSDNAMVGTNIKFTLPKKNLIYFQGILDEFLLSELKADFNQFRNPDKNIQSGWWANKYGFQIGWRKMDWFNIDGLGTRIEYNFVRPYTYAHSAPSQAYSNYNQSLAHPLGANFKEALFVATYSRKKYLFRIHLNYSEKGYSLLGQNLGDNLQASNTTRTSEYENKTTQGELQSVFYSQASMSYLIQPAWNTRINLGLVYRNSMMNSNNEQNSMIYFSLKTNLFNSHFDY